MTQYELEDITLANDILERNYYTYFRNGEKKLEILLDDTQNISIISDWYTLNKFTCEVVLLDKPCKGLNVLQCNNDSDVQNINAVIDNIVNYYKDKHLFFNDVLTTDSKLSINQQSDEYNCSIYSDVLCIRASDLTVGICSGLLDSVPIGKFEVIDNTITKFIPVNVSALILKQTLKKSITPICKNCKYCNICKGFCCADSYREYMNPVIPTEDSCNNSKTVLTFLLWKYKTLGINEYIDKIDINNDYKQLLKQMIKNTESIRSDV